MGRERRENREEEEEENKREGEEEIMLFGVRVRVVNDPMRKSVSLNDLSLYQTPPNSSLGYASADDSPLPSSAPRDRKRGVPWTEEEHKLFLLGLQKVGKGDWRGISRSFVKTRTPTQVASHAQKYFLRKSNLNRRRRRSSLFDITTDSVSTFPMEENVQPLVSPSIISGPQHFPVTMSPIPVSTHIDNSTENVSFGNLGYLNRYGSAEFVHQVPVCQLPTQTKTRDFNLNQRLAEDHSPLSLNLSLSLDQVQDQFSRHSVFEERSSFSNGDSMISVA